MFKKLSSLLFGIVAFSFMAESALADMTLFVGDGCPHCAVVEEYMKDNDIAAKMPIKTFEVWYNESNQALYKKAAEAVGYTGGGVPLLINGMEYKVGDSPIISYFEDIIAGKVKVIQEPLDEKTKSTSEENSGYASVINVDEEPVSNTLSEEDSKDLNETLGDSNWYKDNMKALIGGVLVILAIGATVVTVIRK